MKNNFLKYVFIIIFIGLILFGVYNLYGNQNEQNITKEVAEKKEEIYTNIRLGVANFDSINPILSNNQTIQNISKLVYEPLLNITKDYKIEAGLAKEISKVNATTYILKLRNNVNWTNGNKISAKDIQYTIDKLKDENFNSIYSSNVANVIRVDVVDNETVRITLDKEIPFFEYNLVFPIMSASYYEGVNFFDTEKNIMPVGTGQFIVRENNDNKIVLVKNNEWWNIQNNNSKIEEIEIKKYSTVSEKYNEFKVGSIDLLYTTNVNYEQYAGTIGYSVKDLVGKKTDFLAINTQNLILSDPEVRRAISYAINKQRVNSSIYKGKYFASNFPLDYGSYMCTEMMREGNDQNKNTEGILMANGWEYKQNAWRKTINYSQKKLSFNMVVNANNPERVSVAENIRTQLDEEGIRINLIKANDREYYKYLENKNYDLLLTGIYHSNSPDLSMYLGEDNYSNYYNEEILSILNEVKNITNRNLLQEKYNRIYEIYKEEVPYVMLYNNFEALLYNYGLQASIEANSYNLFYNLSDWYRK